MDDRLKRLSNKANALPMLPGVYIMKNADGDIIYVGKAKALKNRVSSYFRSQDRLYIKVVQMVSRVEDFDYIVCDSEFEALILEASLIKQNMPKYNILLKDDKGYHYIHITDEPWRRITASMQLKPDGENIGPYYSFSVVREAVEQAKRIYKLPGCSRSFSDDMKRSRPCLNYHIGLCASPCSGRMKKSEYLEAVDGAIRFLKHGSDETLAELQRQMQQCSERLDFEQAARLRDRINAIEKLSDKQKVVMSKHPCQDIIAFVRGKSHSCFEVFRFKGSMLCDREHYFTDTPAEDSVARAEFIVQYYSLREDIPPRVLTDGAVDAAESIARYLSQKRGSSVSVLTASRGEPRQLVEMCRSNAAERIAQREGASLRDTAVLDELRRLCGLKKAPEYIEAYDISNTAGADNVGGMVVFENGRPLKKAYRRFAIKGFDGQDDYASLREVLTRRMAEYEQHRDEGEGFGRLPDLFLIDGGAGQLNAVLPILREYGLQGQVFGMVKDSHHRTRALVGEYGELAIKPTKAVFRLITNIQDEVHRFAIGYHHKKSRKRALSMQLLEIEGVGKTRAEALLKHFRGINEIATASVEQLAAAPKMSLRAAESVYNYYHNI